MDIQEKVLKANWDLDKAHSKLGFSVKHMVISKVNGQFDSYEINVQNEHSIEDAEIEVIIDSASINTNMPDRDNHLRSADFFDAEKYPQIIFRSKELKKVDDDNYKMVGDLTIKDITKEITLDLSYGGEIVDPWGNQRIGLTVTGSLNRFDYDLKWNNLIETGGAVVGKMINLNCDVELTKIK